MSAEFWRLPGAAGYVERVHNDITDNRSVVLVLTDITPDGILYELQDAVEKSGLDWHRIYDRPENKHIPCWLAQQCGADLPLSATAADIHRLEAASGKVFVVADIDEKTVGWWSDFLLQFSAAARASKENWAPRFLCLWPTCSKKIPQKDLRLSIHHWAGALNSVDVFLYAALLLNRAPVGQFQKSLAVSIAAKVCGGDPVLCQHLAGIPLEDLINPQKTLAEYAESRGWTAATPLDLSTGSIVSIDGFEREHPAITVVQGRVREINTLVWSAQTGLLMPLLEERRQEIVEELAADLYLPDPQSLQHYQVFENVYDLEIGNIFFQVKNSNKYIRRTQFDQLKRLKTVRDGLAHRKAIPAEYLLCEETIEALTRRC